MKIWLHLYVFLMLILQTSGRVGAFEGYEHLLLGDSACGTDPISVDKNISFTFGELSAIAGDYVNTPEEFERLVNTTPDDLLYIKEVLLRRSARVFSAEVRERVFSTYLKLAQNNFVHFVNPSIEKLQISAFQNMWSCGPSSIDCYVYYHSRALQKATELKETKQSIDSALLLEAFAAHYLSDSYSAGHIRTRRYDIQKMGNNMFPLFLENFFKYSSELIAQGMPSGLFSKDKSDNAQKIELGLRQKLPKNLSFGFGDLLSRAVHDYDSATGLQLGGRRLYGDGHVQDGDTRLVIITAVRNSQIEIRKIYYGIKADYHIINDLQQIAMKHKNELHWWVELDKLMTDERITKGMSLALATIVAELSATMEKSGDLGRVYEVATDQGKAIWAGDVFRSRVLLALSQPEQGIQFINELIDYTPNLSIRGKDAIRTYVLMLNKKQLLRRLGWRARGKLVHDLLESITLESWVSKRAEFRPFSSIIAMVLYNRPSYGHEGMAEGIDWPQLLLLLDQSIDKQAHADRLVSYYWSKRDSASRLLEISRLTALPAQSFNNCIKYNTLVSQVAWGTLRDCNDEQTEIATITSAALKIIGALNNI